MDKAVQTERISLEDSLAEEYGKKKRLGIQYDNPLEEDMAKAAYKHKREAKKSRKSPSKEAFADNAKKESEKRSYTISEGIKIRNLSEQIYSLIALELNKERIDSLKNLEKNLIAYTKSKHKDNALLAEKAINGITGKIKGYNRLIDSKLRETELQVNSAENNEKSLNRLRNAKIELEKLSTMYVYVNNQQGIEKCKGLEKKIDETLGSYRQRKNFAEEMEKQRYETKKYKKAIKQIFKECASKENILNLNRMNDYLTASITLSRTLAKYGSPEVNDRHLSYLNSLKELMDTNTEERIKRLSYESARLRNKLEKSIFCWKEERIIENLKMINEELLLWKKCETA